MSDRTPVVYADAMLFLAYGPDDPQTPALLRALIEAVKAPPLVTAPTAASADPRRAPRRRPSAAGLLSKRTAAARLGIGRDALDRLVDASVIQMVPKGGGFAFRAADVERLIETGYKLPVKTTAPRMKKRRRPVKKGTAPAQRISDLPY